LLAFSLLSLLSLGLWRRKYRKRGPTSSIGQSRDDTIGKIGRLSVPVSPAQHGEVTFAVPVMSSRKWEAIADEEIAAGEEVEVTAIVGNYLRVQRRTI